MNKDRRWAIAFFSVLGFCVSLFLAILLGGLL
jgi:hypothetical protein